ncbi:DgyrCDS373 [Dimorphilus gyrociliatus]|uniref:DgyrCDS373 n=1 Tax=Dimorphilus gyrociliatus TaxID=2664684 RepID=A0A7I8V5W8_9ANNE|nr:DgyrCDS373 [Dimorphilus gyrociliatus]
MADKKFDNMPGIDFNSPSVYETSDLPEDDQSQLTQVPDDSESIENIDASVKEGYDKFKGKGLDAPEIDFSDRISHFRRTGYASFNVYEIEAEGKQETPKQKLQRLQHEIQVLSEDLVKAQKEAESDALPEMDKIVNGADKLQKQLGQLKLDDLLGDGENIALEDPTGALHNRLMNEIEAFKSVSSKKEEKDEGSQDNFVTYQLVARPEQDKFSNLSKVVELEQRLDKLEKVIGYNQQSSKILASQLSGKSLTESCQYLASQISLLQPNTIDAVDARLQSVSFMLNQLKEQGPENIEAEKLAKVDEVKTLLEKYENVVDGLPLLVDRLSSLNELHQHALEFNTALTQLENSQGQIANLLQSHTDDLKELKTTMADNTKILQDNAAEIESKIKSIRK